MARGHELRHLPAGPADVLELLGVAVELLGAQDRVAAESDDDPTRDERAVRVRHERGPLG